MIPVFQNRYAVETFGNCFEACLASILELPLSAVPDRAALVNLDRWADDVARARVRGGEDAVGDLDLPAEYDDGERVLRTWLADRGLAWTDVELGPRTMTPGAWLDLVGEILQEGFWIAHSRSAGWMHATVWRGAALAHDPHRGLTLQDDTTLERATLLVAGDPAKVARTLQPLPDVAGVLARAAA